MYGNAVEGHAGALGNHHLLVLAQAAKRHKVTGLAHRHPDDGRFNHLIERLHPEHRMPGQVAWVTFPQVCLNSRYPDSRHIVVKQRCCGFVARRGGHCVACAALQGESHAAACFICVVIVYGNAVAGRSGVGREGKLLAQPLLAKRQIIAAPGHIQQHKQVDCRHGAGRQGEGDMPTLALYHAFLVTGNADHRQVVIGQNHPGLVVRRGGHCVARAVIHGQNHRAATLVHAVVIDDNSVVGKVGPSADAHLGGNQFAIRHIGAHLGHRQVDHDVRCRRGVSRHPKDGMRLAVVLVAHYQAFLAKGRGDTDQGGVVIVYGNAGLVGRRTGQAVEVNRASEQPEGHSARPFVDLVIDDLDSVVGAAGIGRDDQLLVAQGASDE